MTVSSAAVIRAKSSSSPDWLIPLGLIALAFIPVVAGAFRLTTLALVASAVAIERPALRVSRRDLLICAGVGIGDTLGNALYAAASRSGLESLTSVLASLYPIVTVALAAAFLKERMAGAQRLGIGLTLTGVVLISL